MTGKVVNLNRARKTRARVAAKAEADANALKFGRTRAERAAETAEAQRIARELDGKKRED